MAVPSPTTSYSARVRLWLSYGGRSIPLTHTSGTFIIAAEAVDLPPGDATIVYTIDEKRHERKVHLTEGMSPDRRETPVLSRDVVAPF